jgi:L-ascorbate metabolism protein UlaG (beta-lactamase superfamily)
MWRFFKLRFGGDESLWSKWPKRLENSAYPVPAGPAVTWIGHSSFLIRLPGLNILTDPVFSERCSPVAWAGPKRVRAPGVALADLPPVGLILLSHNHYDHMDIPALRRIRRAHPQAAIVTSLGNAAFLARKGLAGAVELDWWQSTVAAGATVTATPARHFAARTLWDRNETLWCGFMIEAAGRKIYFAGDSGFTRYFAEIGQRLGSPDLALIPIGAYEPRDFMGPVHIDPAEAVQAFLDVGAKRAIGMHFGTFQLTAEAIDAPVRELAVACTTYGIPSEAFVTMDVGDSHSL